MAADTEFIDGFIELKAIAGGMRTVAGGTAATLNYAMEEKPR